MGGSEGRRKEGRRKIEVFVICLKCFLIQLQYILSTSLWDIPAHFDIFSDHTFPTGFIIITDSQSHWDLPLELTTMYRLATSLI